MLLQFKVKNFKCFYEETVLDLTATQEKAHAQTLIEKNGYNVLPIVEIHGANASGKTSILEALTAMRNIVVNSSKMDVNDQLLYSPFLFDKKNIGENMEFEISLALSDTEYRYGFSLNDEKIAEEWFYKKKFLKTSTEKEKMIFERYNGEVNFGTNFKKYEKIWNFFKNSNENKLLVLSNIAIKQEEGPFREVYDYLRKTNINIENFRISRPRINIINSDDIKSKFNELLQEVDPCLVGIDIEEVENGDRKEFKISGVHKMIDQDEKSLLPFHLESNGTIKFFDIMPQILANLEDGGLICFDEIDTKLHPLLFRRIVNMYKDKELNKHNAQLVYTAHSTFLFNSNDLRRDELYLVEKNSKGMSNLYSLSEFRNLRVDADYEKKYLTGEFGAIPFQDK